MGLLGPPPPPPPPVGLKLPEPSKLAVSGFMSRGDCGPIELMVRLFSRLIPGTVCTQFWRPHKHWHLYKCKHHAPWCISWDLSLWYNRSHICCYTVPLSLWNHQHRDSCSHLHAPAAWPPSSQWIEGWAPETVHMFWRSKKSLAPAWNQLWVLKSHGPSPILTTYMQLMDILKFYPNSLITLYVSNIQVCTNLLLTTSLTTWLYPK